MSYIDAIRAAGQNILAYKKFGSYSGDLLVAINTCNGVEFINIAFGSCSVCDAFEAEFDFYDYDYVRCDEHRYELAIGECDRCKQEQNDYQIRLKRFGERYVRDAITYKELLAYATKNLDWDSEAEPMVEWIKQFDPEK